MSLLHQANKSFFSEIIASISDISFSKDGRYIVSRDFMTLKLWDLAKENAPVATYSVHEQLRARVSGWRCLVRRHLLYPRAMAVSLKVTMQHVLIVPSLPPLSLSAA